MTNINYIDNDDLYCTINIPIFVLYFPSLPQCPFMVVSDNGASFHWPVLKEGSIANSYPSLPSMFYLMPSGKEGRLHVASAYRNIFPFIKGKGFFPLYFL